MPELTAKEGNIEIGGRKVVTLSQPHTADPSQPQILGADILPGRGMNIYQIHAYIPGKGEVGLLSAPSLEEAKGLMNGGAGDEYGTQSFKMGGAILAPFANRIRGKLSADGKTIATTSTASRCSLPRTGRARNPALSGTPCTGSFSIGRWRRRI